MKLKNMMSREAPVFGIIPGQLRNVSLDRMMFLTEQIDYLEIYTDEESLGLLSGTVLMGVAKNIDPDPKFLELMAPAKKGNEKAKLYQWARLHFALKSIKERIVKGELPSELVILRLRTDIDFENIDFSKVRGMSESHVAAKSDWVFAFHSSDLEVMLDFYRVALDWVSSRHLMLLDSNAVQRCELGTLRVNWPAYSTRCGSLLHIVMRSYRLFSLLGRPGEFFHRSLVRIGSFLDNKGFFRRAIKVEASGRLPLDTNWLPSETLFTWYLMNNFQKVHRLTPIGRGNLVSRSKRLVGLVQD